MDESFATELKVAMVRAGITEEILGTLVGVHSVTISRWLTGFSKPSPANLIKLRKFLTLEPGIVRVYSLKKRLKRPRKNERRKN